MENDEENFEDKKSLNTSNKNNTGSTANNALKQTPASSAPTLASPSIKKSKRKFGRFAAFMFAAVLLILGGAVVLGCAKLKPAKIEQFYLDKFFFSDGSLSAVVNVVFESNIPLNFDFSVKELSVFINDKEVEVDVSNKWHKIRTGKSNRIALPVKFSLEKGIVAALDILNKKNSNFAFVGMGTYRLGTITKDVKFNRNFDMALKDIIKISGVLNLLNLLKKK